VCWFLSAIELLDVGNLDQARDDLWTRVAFMTRYGGATLTEALCEVGAADAEDYCAAIGRLIKQENSKRD